MPRIDVDGLTFVISDQFLATKYDEWAFYRRQIDGRISGAKAVDVLIVARDASVSYFVEVKDFRTNPATSQPRIRTKPSELHDEIAAKVLHSLGGVLAARTRATVNIEGESANLTCSANRLRVVLYLEQSSGHGVFRQIIDPANLQIKLRKVVKGIDPHAMVVSRTTATNLPWQVNLALK